MRIFILVVLWQCEFTIIHGQVILNVGQKYILQKNISDIFVVKNYSNTCYIEWCLHSFHMSATISGILTWD